MRLLNRFPRRQRAVLVLALTICQPLAADVLTLKQSIRTELNSSTNVVIGRYQDESLIAIQGRCSQQPSRAAVELYNQAGQRQWRYVVDEPTTPGAYLQWLTGASETQPLIALAHVPKDKTAPGTLNLLRVADGQQIHMRSNNAHFGNNNSLLVDLNGDGQDEFLYGDQQTLTALDIGERTPRWTYQQGINFCWSLPAAANIDGERDPEIVFGSEYDAQDGSSSVIAIDHQGRELWRSTGHAEDLGSTPVIIADTNADRQPEIVKVGLDLVHHRNQQWSHLHIFDRHGKLLHRHRFGCTGLALGNFDDDPQLEGVGISNSRDGGHNGRAEIRCIDLVTGQFEWTVPVDRAYLDCNSPVVADVNGDGRPEAIVGTGNPSGYARLPNSQPWGDLYVVDGRGNVLQKQELAGWPVNTAFCDIDQDGLNELAVVVDGQPGAIRIYDTQAPATRTTWLTPLGNAGRTGTSTVSE